MCATMQKFRIRDWSTAQLAYEVPSRRVAGSLRGNRDPLLQSAAVANIKSQIKRNRQNEVRRVRNKSVRSALKTTTKKVAASVEAGDREAAEQGLGQALRQLDKAASKGSLHKRAAARRKSRLTRSVNAAAASE